MPLPEGDWIDLQLGSWWEDDLHAWGDEDGDEATDATPGYGSADGDGLSQGFMLRLNSDFDELIEDPEPGDEPLRDLAIAGILPGDGEVVPLTFGFGSNQSLADATWTLAWDSSRIRIWTPVFDENGDFVEYVEQQSGWSGQVADENGNWYWWQNGVGAWVEAVDASQNLDDIEFMAMLDPDGANANTRDEVKDTVKATALDFDLAVDSDNTGLAADAGQTAYEDYVEGAGGSKLMVVNWDDDDEDGYADYAGRNPGITSGGSSGIDNDWVPISLNLSSVLQSSIYKISFLFDGYSEVDVATETRQIPAYDGEIYDKYLHSLGEGLFRLWLVESSGEHRLIRAGEAVAVTDLLGGGDNAHRLYLEAINGAISPQSIVSSVWDADETLLASDRIQVVPLDPVLGLSSELQLEGYNIIRAGSEGAVEGTSGNDLIIGTANNDSIHAGMGDDIVIPFAGDDEIELGEGNDLVFGFFGNTKIAADSADVISYIEGAHYVDAQPEPQPVNPFAFGMSADAAQMANAASNAPKRGIRSMNGKDILAAYKWMFGNDIWLQLFTSHHINGRVVAVSDRREDAPEYEVNYKDTGGWWTGEKLEEVVVKITYGQIDQIEAANQLRAAILDKISKDYQSKVNAFLTDIFTSAKSDKVVFAEALQTWQELRERNIAYVAEIATLAAQLNPFFFVGGAGASAVQAIFELPALAEASVAALKSVFEMIPLIPGDTSAWEEDDGEAPAPAMAFLSEESAFFAAINALSVGNLTRLRIASALRTQLFDVLKDVIKPAGNALGFVWRRDFINNKAVAMALEVITAVNGKTTLILGTAQKVIDNGVETTHAATALSKARELAETGLYSHITLSRNWRTATGRIGDWKNVNVKVLQDRIPDIIAVRWDGKVVPFEVVSPGQANAEGRALLIERMRESIGTLPSGNQTLISPAGNLIELGT